MSNTVFKTSLKLTKQQTTKVTLWVKPRVKEALGRSAASYGLTMSKVGATLLERALQQHIDMQYGEFLIPIIEQAIAKDMQGANNRLAWLLVRIAVDVGQIRGVVTNILGRQQGVNEEQLKHILQESRRAAKLNMTRSTPQLTELMEALTQWLHEHEKQRGKKDGNR